MNHPNTDHQTALLNDSKSGSTLYGVPEGYDAIVLAQIAQSVMAQDKTLIHIALDDRRINILKDTLALFAPDVDVTIFPAWDCLPYDRVSPQKEISAARIKSLSILQDWHQTKIRAPRICLTSVNAITQKILPQNVLSQMSFNAQAGKKIDHENLQNFLITHGYVRTDTVREAGEYAIRGSIIDLFPPGYEFPLRLDTFGDDIETIKMFDPLSQRSLEKLSQITLLPASEFDFSDQARSRFRQSYREVFQTTGSDDPLYEAVSDGRHYNGMEHWLPLFYESMDTLFDYVPSALVSCDQNALQARDDRMKQIKDFFQARKTLEKASQKTQKQKAGSTDISLSGSIYYALSPEYLYISDKSWDSFKERIGFDILSPFGGPDLPDLRDYNGRKGRDFSSVRSLPDGDVLGDLKQHIEDLRDPKRRIIISSFTQGSRSRIKDLLQASGHTNLKLVDTLKDIKQLHPRETGMVLLPLEDGFVAPDFAVITETDILGDRLVQKSKKRKKADQFLTEVSALNPGDLVVHIDHGIGRFDKLETLKAAGTFHDCLQITYHGGDRLFVPVENIDVLSRFGGDEGTVQLDKMGGAGWQARKAKVKQDLMAMADDLLKIAAQRHLRPAQKIDISSELYKEFTTRFPYAETEDQQRAISDVMKDLSAGRPMDRLVCGDVGFGKTEIALRASYIAAMNGYQVAVVVPTTLLARQHFMTFQKRFAGMGLRIEQMSRLVPQKDIKQVKQGLADGTVNIVVGTHALLGKAIQFDNLGLLIIDEEQRFGVKQKEKLKELKSDIHVLTLTATPIPRTLQLSLTGVKELSLITTPPVDRLAIRTFIMPYDPLVIREAIMREHYRGGQSFYVCPRIKDLEELESALKELVPEVKAITAHGQMPSTDLEDRMNAFYDGQYGLLLATNIIESGLDIPTANTMIVHRADMFGLSQLYQIRGRIGRSKIRAYAYLTYEPSKALNENAQKRLEVMETLDSLGAGFQLASHDMDIRGAGNLLGDAQSGHIKEVGIELYQQMLEEAVAAAKDGDDSYDQAEQNTWSPQINLGTSVLIPDNYVEDLNVRMSLYRRLGNLKDESDLQGFAAELIDRFGPIPDEVQNLLDIVDIKQLCLRAGISKIEGGPKGAVIGFYNDNPPNLEGLIGWMAEKAGAAKLRHDQKIVVVRAWDKPSQRVKGVRSLAKELTNIVT